MHNTTNIVTVEYINADYDKDAKGGFAKRIPKGYNGSSATRPNDNKYGLAMFKGDDDDQESGPDGAYGDDNGLKTGGEIGEVNPSKHMTDDQIRDLMLNDPGAGRFLDGMIEGSEQKF